MFHNGATFPDEKEGFIFLEEVIVGCRIVFHHNLTSHHHYTYFKKIIIITISSVNCFHSHLFSFSGDMFVRS